MQKNGGQAPTDAAQGRERWEELAGESSAGTRQQTEFTLRMLTKLMTEAVPGLPLGRSYRLVERIVPAGATHMLTQFN